MPDSATSPTFRLHGRPHYDDPAFAARAAADGDEAAWRAAFDAGRDAALKAAAQARGAFAVEIRDADGRRGFAAVDRFAVHTLCHASDGATIRFDTRADALTRAPVVSIEPQAIHDYFDQHHIAAPDTVFRDVGRLPAAHALWFEAGHAGLHRYWTPAFTEPRSASFDALRARFLTLLEESVGRALDAGTKPACFLSGGTDSSTVAGMIGRVAGRPASTYSMGFDAKGYDEMAYARIAARHFGCDHHEHYVTPDELVRDIPRVAAAQDQPFGNSSGLPTFICAQQAHDDGVTRLLAGDGGDELFGGNSRYAKQRVFDAYTHVPAPLRRGLFEPLARSPLGTLPLGRKLRSYVEQATTPMPARGRMYNLLVRLGPERVFTPALLAGIDAARVDRLQAEVWTQADAPGTLNRTLAFDWRHTLAENDLPKVRQGTQLAGVDVAFPLLDPALVEFSTSLPNDYKLRGTKLRWFFKEALRGFLPDEILTKTKHGFGLPFGVWCLEHAGLRSLATNSVRGLVHRNAVRREFVDELLDRHLPAHPGYYGEMVFIMMMLEQWLRHHADDWRL